MHQINHLNLEQKFGWNKWWRTGTYNKNTQIKFKTTMLKSSLCNYSDEYILFKGNITVNNTAVDGDDANNTSKKVIS